MGYPKLLNKPKEVFHANISNLVYSLDLLSLKEQVSKDSIIECGQCSYLIKEESWNINCSKSVT